MTKLLRSPPLSKTLILVDDYHKKRREKQNDTKKQEEEEDRLMGTLVEVCVNGCRAALVWVGGGMGWGWGRGKEVMWERGEEGGEGMLSKCACVLGD